MDYMPYTTRLRALPSGQGELRVEVGQNALERTFASPEAAASYAIQRGAPNPGLPWSSIGSNTVWVHWDIQDLHEVWADGFRWV